MKQLVQKTVTLDNTKRNTQLQSTTTTAKLTYSLQLLLWTLETRTQLLSFQKLFGYHGFLKMQYYKDLNFHSLVVSGNAYQPQYMQAGAAT